MSLTELQIAYPYIPGKGGVRWEEIILGGEGLNKRIWGASGRALEYSLREDYLRIDDVENIGYSLSACYYESGKYLSFAYYTKAKTEKDRATFPNGRHPDFYAKKFVIFALDHFRQKGFQVDGIKAHWGITSDNYRVYRDAINRTNDFALAAGSTWSGRLYISLGFTKLRLFYDFPNRDDVSIFFSRPGLK